MAGLTFTFSSPAPGIRHWDLRGPDGVVRFETADGFGLHTQSVYLHATSYLQGADVGDCDVCGKGYHDALASRYALSLREAWEIEGCNDDVIRAELERWYNELLSSGVEKAATGAGEEVEGPSVDPVPVAAHLLKCRESEGCSACGTCIDHDGCADPENPLRDGDCVECGACASCIAACAKARSTPEAASSGQGSVFAVEISDELVELVARAQYEYDTDDIPTGLGYAWDETIAAVRNEYVRRARAGLEVAIPLLRKQWENEQAKPRWGSGPLVVHNPDGAQR